MYLAVVGWSLSKKISPSSQLSYNRRFENECGDGTVEEAKAELRTILDMIRYGMTQLNRAGCFFGHGTDNAWDEALNLVLFALHLDHNMKKEILNARLTASERQTILTLFQKRIHDKTPAAYLTNRAYFADLEFYVDERVLVPRSPVAELIEERFSPWIDEDQIESVLDLCTGSACIAIASAMHMPYAGVDAIDISHDALAVAQKNIDTFNLQDQVQAIHSDLFESVKGKQYDVIISNPPYVDQADIDSMPAEFHHEPRIGLAAGDDGLDIVITILQQAADHLTEHGILICEVGNSAYALEQRCPDIPFTWLDFERGGDGVFLLTAHQCQEFARKAK